MDFTQEQLQEMKEIGMFDFITINRYKLTKEEIVYLFREYSYAVYDATSKEDEKEIVENMVCTIREQMYVAQEIDNID